LKEFFGWQSTKPRHTEASPRTCCLGHLLFEAELQYDTRSDAKLEALLVMALVRFEYLVRSHGFPVLVVK
jgi:hypothetical protein